MWSFQKQILFQLTIPANGTIISHHKKRDEDASKENLNKDSIESKSDETVKEADKKERRKRETDNDSVAEDSKIQAVSCLTLVSLMDLVLYKCIGLLTFVNSR